MAELAVANEKGGRNDANAFPGEGVKKSIPPYRTQPGTLWLRPNYQITVSRFRNARDLKAVPDVVYEVALASGAREGKVLEGNRPVNRQSNLHVKRSSLG